MRLTIVPSDNVVLVDGRGLKLDLTGYASLDGIHAVQWNDDAGHIEYIATEVVRLNEPIDSIDPYQDIIDAWTAAAVAQDKAIATITTFNNAPIMGGTIREIIT